MLTFLTRGAAFIAVSIALLLGLELSFAALIFEDQRPKYADLFNRQAEPRNLILGPSTVAYGLNPDYLTGQGSTFYNFAMTGVNPAFTLEWYRIFRRYHEAPHAVVLSADAFSFRDSLQRRIEQDACFMPAPLALEVALRPSSHTRDSFTNGLALVRGKKRLENLITGQPQRIELASEHLVRGFAPIRNYPFVRSEQVQYSYVPAQEAAYVQLVQLLRSEGVQVLMLQMPIMSAATEHRTDDNARLRAIAEVQGIPFLNYNEERHSALNERKDAFYDTLHLNQRGTDVFGPMLAADLRALDWPKARAANRKETVEPSPGQHPSASR